MKKILALVLALVMTLSLATISSGAAYSDADSVQYTDAVNTMSALGVLGGYGDGTIRPAADVTRGAAAKMVAMVATGSNTTAIGYYKGTSSFADVPATHTFADAVAFCVARGIVAGYGDGTYGVADNVKGWAVAKMVLVAMGYDAKAYGMEGAGSALNTITLASKVGLFAGMKADFAATDAASREECAQIVYNALTLNGKTANPTSSDGVVTFSDSDTCLLNNYAGVAKVAKADLGDVTALEAMAANIGMVTANQATGDDYTVIGGDDFAVETGKELVGHVVMVVPNGASDDYGTPCVYAVVDLSSEVVVAEAIAKKADFEAAFGTTAPAIDTDGSNANVADIVAFDNYDVDSLPVGFEFANGDTKATTAGTYVIYDGTVVSYLAASSDLVVLTVKVDNATKGYYTVFADANSNGAVDGGETVYVKVAEAAADCEDLITSAAAIDWMAMVEAPATTAKAVYVGTPCGSKLAVEEVKTVEGKVTMTNGTSKKVTVNGTAYEYVTTEAVAAAALGTGIAEMPANFTDMTNTIKFYLDEAGKIFAYIAVTDETADTNSYELAYVVGTSSNIIGVDAFGHTTATFNVQYYKLDGSVNLASYVAKDGATLVYEAPATGEAVYSDVAPGWYLLANVTDGVALKTIDGTGDYILETMDTASDVALTATLTKVDGNFITKASTFLYSTVASMAADNAAATVMTGAHANTIAATKVVKVVKTASANEGQYDLVAAWVADDFGGEDVAADFVYVVSYEGYLGLDASKTQDLQSYKVIDKNGAESTVTYAVATASANGYVGGFYEISTNSATGLTTFTGPKTGIVDVAGYNTYVVDGVKYLAKASDEFVVDSGVKMYDLRAGVAAGTADAVATVDGMLAITDSYKAYTLSTTDTATGVITINTIIVTD